MADTRDLHKDIFGEDSDDDDYMPPTRAALEGDDDEEDESRAQQILEAQGNNLLLGKSKAKEKKAKEKKAKGGSSGRSKRKADDDGGGRRKRLQRSGAGEGEEHVEIVRTGDDPDQDSLSGSEAMEDNRPEEGASGFDKPLKPRRGPKVYNREKLVADFKELQERMETAYTDDQEASRSDPPQPAIYKVGMLGEVQSIMRKKQYHETLIDHGMLSTLSRWLAPMDNGSLVSLELRTAILESLLLLDVDETVLGALRSSGIGKYIRLFSLHKRETKENKRTALRLIEKWSRPIFQTSEKVQAKDLPIANEPRGPRQRREEDEPLFAPSGPQTGNHARVPRPMGMDFTMLPASNVEAARSSKFAKDSVKGRLQDRMLHGKRKDVSQAVTLSIEGRGVDRI